MKTQKKNRCLLCGIVIVAGSILETFGQGSFQNLNFESATIVPIVSGGRTFAQFGPAFPGWTGYFNSSPLSPAFTATYNDPNAGTVGIGLVNAQTQFGIQISNYTAILQGSTLNGSPDVSLAQTGVIPPGTMSLRFLASQRQSTFIVSLNGQPLSYGILQDFGLFREFGADISGFAGQSTELRFTQRSGLGFEHDLFLDNIAFSPDAVPEPGVWALLALGGTALWCAARRRRK